MVYIYCDACGKRFKIYPYKLRIEGKKYCGRKCADSRIASAVRKHGMSYTHIYNVWLWMKSRCTSTIHREHYKDRGIVVCNEWLNSFETFRDWALKSGYSKELELDRKDSDKGYNPDNCRWTTRQQQMRNTRKRKDAKTSIYKGVSWNSQNGNWRVQIQCNGKTKTVGSFVDEIAAAKAYDKAAIEVYGEYARLNFK